MTPPIVVSASSLFMNPSFTYFACTSCQKVLTSKHSWKSKHWHLSQVGDSTSSQVFNPPSGTALLWTLCFCPLSNKREVKDSISSSLSVCRNWKLKAKYAAF